MPWSPIAARLATTTNGARKAPKAGRGNACLPYFRKLEHDFDFDGPFHGKEGPISIRRISEAAMSPFVKAVSNTLAAQGHVAKPDQNGEWTDGIYTSAIAVTRDGERIPTSIAYLSPEVRRRANLRIITDRLVDRILFDGTRATGAVTLPAAGGARRRSAPRRSSSRPARSIRRLCCCGVASGRRGRSARKASRWCSIGRESGGISWSTPVHRCVHFPAACGAVARSW